MLQPQRVPSKDQLQQQAARGPACRALSLAGSLRGEILGSLHPHQSVQVSQRSPRLALAGFEVQVLTRHTCWIPAKPANVTQQHLPLFTHWA